MSRDSTCLGGNSCQSLRVLSLHIHLSLVGSSLSTSPHHVIRHLRITPQAAFLLRHLPRLTGTVVFETLPLISTLKAVQFPVTSKERRVAIQAGAVRVAGVGLGAAGGGGGRGGGQRRGGGWWLGWVREGKRSWRGVEKGLPSRLRTRSCLSGIRRTILTVRRWPICSTRMELWRLPRLESLAQVIYYRETDQSIRFGFMTMSTVEEAEKAVEMFSGFIWRCYSKWRRSTGLQMDLEIVITL